MTTQENGHDAAPSEGTVTVTEADSGAYTQQITAGRHRLVADEPQPVGADAGPTPYDLLLAALGACTSMTVRMYANRKGWPLERVRVTLRHSRIHARDCADCETTSGWIDHIDRDVELTGDLDDTQRQRLLHIAERCPVHQTLTSEVHIATSLW
jgi:putative redox protein